MGRTPEPPWTHSKLRRTVMVTCQQSHYQIYEVEFLQPQTEERRFLQVRHSGNV